MYTFECPHCEHECDLDNSQIDKPVACPHCAKTFMAEVPKGRVVKRTSETDTDSSVANDAVKESAEDSNKAHAPVGEVGVAKTHPVALRSKPFSSVLLILCVLAGVAGVITVVSRYDISQLHWKIAAVACVVVSIVAFCKILWWLISVRFESLEVTTHRTIWRRGFFRREMVEIEHDDVRKIEVDQTLLQRLLRVGTLRMASAGTDRDEIRFEGLSRPADICKLIRQPER